MIRPGLDPPWTAVGKNDNLLTATRAADAAGNGVDALAGALSGGRNFAEFNGGMIGVAADRKRE